MKSDLHPSFNTIKFSCACGSTFDASSTREESVHVDICSMCHPFFTGKEKLIDTAGRIEQFKKRYQGPQKSESAANTKAKPA